MKYLSFRQGLSGVLFWSIISAAFIGPGTVTTCGLAGATYGTSLLWALVFSIGATMVLQEAAARLTIATGQNLGEIISLRLGARGRGVNRALAVGVVLGCAAYEAGNILGAVAGIRLLLDLPGWVLTILISTAAYFFLSIQSVSVLSRVLGVVVFGMGAAFIWVGTSALEPERWGEVVWHSLVPSFPAGAAVLITGLVGTTVVPYNLFLASGIGKGQSVAEMRQGIILAVLIGGIISVCILLGGTLVQGTFSYQNAAEVLSVRLGTYGRSLYAIGLLGAGFTSVVTAPFAAALTTRSLLGFDQAQSRRVWQGVLLMGFFFGLLDTRPIPIIIAAQAANGLLLPFITWQIIRATSDARILPLHRNTRLQKFLLGLIFLVTALLGASSLLSAFKSLL
ncbi:Nramp family divalent metal transporter [Rhabdobacter roseus]|uniref:Mn2+/Fe2+ NRAMP family transporter n=1 Tax=Rhabdobacter roseus TaxID=1655419 RepID=A0A840TIU9_9BACT|nr:Nramp family divalent metal transporter [Rhabdobacter roseus]MBB5283291.1 Mn2+/Fe2+ NRAMP family transporter [Rhabdobacter roseus]